MIFDAGLIDIISEVAEKIEDMVADCHYGRKSSQTKDMTAHARVFKKEYRMNWVPPVPVPQSDSEMRARIFRMKTEIAYFTKLAMEIGRMDIAEDLMHAESGLENAAATLPCNISNLAPVNALNIAMTQPRPAAFGLAA